MESLTSLQHDPQPLISAPSDIVNTGDNSAVAAPSNSNSSSSSSASRWKQASDSLKLRPRDFVWGAKVIRNALPDPTIPPWLDPLDVDIDDPKKLPLCWYGVPFYSGIVFAYAKRIRLGVYMKRENLNLKPGDLDIYKTWPKFVKWFEDQSSFTMQLHQVWDERMPLLTFFSNREIRSVTDENWELINAMLDEMEYPREIEPMWYLDRRLNY
ncbi:hypothetical protein V8D89_011401 [Ganoderma adspersum]